MRDYSLALLFAIPFALIVGWVLRDLARDENNKEEE